MATGSNALVTPCLSSSQFQCYRNMAFFKGIISSIPQTIVHLVFSLTGKTTLADLVLTTLNSIQDFCYSNSISDCSAPLRFGTRSPEGYKVICCSSQVGDIMVFSAENESL